MHNISLFFLVDKHRWNSGRPVQHKPQVVVLCLLQTLLLLELLVISASICIDETGSCL